MRIRGAKTELEEAGLETEGMAESTATLRNEILALSGVDIMIDDSTFKSTYDILDELSKKWQDLTDIQQASITELIAGKRQGQVVSAVMNNFDIARKVVTTSEGSEGSATAEHEKWLDSLEAKINQLAASWESLSQAFLEDDFIANGSVIGEFICDGIYHLLAHPKIFAGHPLFFAKAIKDACLVEAEVEAYSGGKDVAGWHISDLKLYDKPKRLEDFGLTRAPQSWCYVREVA